MNVLEVKNLSKHYKDFDLDHVSFTVPQGSITGFVGINGAGKTTTIKLMLDLINKDSGEIYYQDQSLQNNRKEIMDKIGVVLDSDCFYEDMTIREMKNIIAPMYKSWNPEKYQGYLQKFRLDDSKKIRILSKGMKMKFALTLALSHETEFLILDEPVNGLDPLVRNELNQILKDYTRDGQKSVFFSTHIISDLEEIADHIVFMDHGTIVFEKTMMELIAANEKNNGQKPFSIENLMIEYVRGHKL